MIPKSAAIISVTALWFMIIVRHNWYIVETNVISQTGNVMKYKAGRNDGNCSFGSHTQWF